MKKKYQVFVSSTYTDLIDERKEVIQALLETDCIPSGMELFPAASTEQWEWIKKVIDDCDYYLLILAGKYGSMGTDDLGRKVGYTEMEFDYAMQTSKPIMVFIHSDYTALPNTKVEQTQRNRKRLDTFINKAKTGRLVKFWDNKDNLKSAVLSSIPKMIESCPAIGWVRADSFGHTAPHAPELDEEDYDDYFPFMRQYENAKYRLSHTERPSDAILTTDMDYVKLSCRNGNVSDFEARLALCVIDRMRRLLPPGTNREMLLLRGLWNNDQTPCFTIYVDYLYDWDVSPRFTEEQLEHLLEDDYYGLISTVEAKCIGEYFDSDYFFHNANKYYSRV